MRRPLLLAMAAAAACGGDGADRAGEPDGSIAGAGDAARPDDGVIELAVDGDAAWTPAEVDVARGELVRVSASGMISFDGATEVGPAGFAPDDHDAFNAVGCADHASLIARVNAGGGAFALAAEQRLLAPRAGALAFGPNDTRTADNTGAFRVVVELGQPVELIERRSVTVPGSAGWIDTGIDVHPEHLLAIDGDGTVDNNIPDQVDYGPEGVPDSVDDPYSVLACANHMALIGKVGVDGAPFPVGRDMSRPALDGGRLFLRVNHTVPDANTGKFSAGILIGR